MFRGRMGMFKQKILHRTTLLARFQRVSRLPGRETGRGHSGDKSLSLSGRKLIHFLNCVSLAHP